MAYLRTLCLLLLTSAACTWMAGCVDDTVGKTPPALLPAGVRLHPFTGTRQFDESGDLRGIEARVEVRDHFDDATKAFGTFRFEAYGYRPFQSDPRGKTLAKWAVDLTSPEPNLNHWDTIHHTYRFRLKWDAPLPIGRQFVLRIVFSPPDGPRLFSQRVFVMEQ